MGCAAESRIYVRLLVLASRSGLVSWEWWLSSFITAASCSSTVLWPASLPSVVTSCARGFRGPRGRPFRSLWLL